MKGDRIVYMCVCMCHNGHSESEELFVSQVDVSSAVQALMREIEQRTEKTVE